MKRGLIWFLSLLFSTQTVCASGSGGGTRDIFPVDGVPVSHVISGRPAYPDVQLAPVDASARLRSLPNREIEDSTVFRVDHAGATVCHVLDPTIHFLHEDSYIPPLVVKDTGYFMMPYQSPRTTPQYVYQYRETPEYRVDESTSAQQEHVRREDGRRQVERAHQWPYSAHCHLDLYFSGLNEKLYAASGVMIGPRHVLTCAHNVHCIRERAPWTVKVNCYPALNNEYSNFGQISVIRIYVSPAWIAQEPDENHDLALLVLDKPIGDQTGYYGLAVLNDATLPQHPIEVTGYPGDKGCGKMYTMEGVPTEITPTRITYRIDTSPGQSGGAVWTSLDGQPYVVGIHTRGHIMGNSGVRLSLQQLSWLHENMNHTKVPRARALTHFERGILSNQITEGIIPRMSEASYQHFKNAGVPEADLKCLNKYYIGGKFRSLTTLHMRAFFPWRWFIGPEKDNVVKVARAFISMMRHMPMLSELKADDCCEDSQIQIFAEALPDFKNLRILRVANTNANKASKIRNTGALALARALPNIPTLYLLSLEGNDIGSEGRQALEAAKPSSCLIFF